MFKKKRDIVLAKPFLKWAGSKKWLSPHINKYIPAKFKKYFEPFVGSGAIFFALCPQNAQLSDTNKHLIEAYEVIQKFPYAVIRELKGMPYDKDFYYELRDSVRGLGKVKRAARFIYLNQACWNGLYRENKNGKFNVPFGKQKNPQIFDADNIIKIATALKDIKLHNCDFETAVLEVRPNDFIFFDPPYITSHQNNGFCYYNAKLFSWNDQQKLANLVRHLNEKGCFILVTNADHQSIKELYAGFSMTTLTRNSMIAADIKSRKIVKELLITNYRMNDSNDT